MLHGTDECYLGDCFVLFLLGHLNHFYVCQTEAETVLLCDIWLVQSKRMTS